MIKRLLLTIYLFSNFMLLSQSNLIISSEPLLALSEYELDDCTMNDRSITFFLPVKNIDVSAWKKSLTQFLKQSKLESIDVNVIFFNRNQGKNSGVKVIDNNKKNIFSTFTITCLVSGYELKNLDRIKGKMDTLYKTESINATNYNVALVTVTDFLECAPNFKDKTKEIMAKEELDRYKPFLTELYFPKYSTDEKFSQQLTRIELLEKSGKEKDDKIQQLETKIINLEKIASNLPVKDEIAKHEERTSQKEKKKKKKLKKK